MQSLRLLAASVVPPASSPSLSPSPSPSPPLPPSLAIAPIQSANRILVASLADNSLRIHAIDSANNTHELLTSWPLDSQDHQHQQQHNVRVVGCASMPDSPQDILVSLSNGSLILVKNTQSTDSVSSSLIGTIDPGLVAFAPSPDAELLLFLSTSASLVLMTTSFVPVHEIPLFSALETRSLVNVGWGRKETQFHGRVGKDAATKSSNLLPSTSTLSPDDDHLARIDWRGDASRFAISSVSPSTNTRQIRIFDRDLNLLNVSESLPMLEHTLSFQPSGTLITSSQRIANKHAVVFFETNGLFKSEFSLNDKQEPLDSAIVEMAWNCDSSVLALHLARSSGKNVIQLYTMSNYHYYLAQTLDIKPNTVWKWDPETPMTLHSAGPTLEYRGYTFSSEVLSASHIIPVIDGSRLHITPFAFMNVPPPMSAQVITTTPSSPLITIRNVAFGNTTPNRKKFHDLAILCGNESVQIFETKFGRPMRPPTQNPNIPLPSSQIYRSVVFPDPSLIMVLGTCVETSTDILTTCLLDPETHELAQTYTTSFKTPILSLHHDPASGLILLVTLTSILQITQFSKDSGVEIAPYDPCPSPPGSTTLAASLRIKVINSTLLIHSGLDLTLNDTRLAADVTSFRICGEFILFTNTSHELVFAPIADVGSVRIDATTWARRRVERGAKIVAAVEDGVEVVLQMPRGNLETIRPRPLSLSRLQVLLAANDYHSAFLICRKDKIDFNLLYDIDPASFLGFVDGVVKDGFRKAEFLNLFLTGLKNHDVWESMKTTASSPPTSSSQKSPPDSASNKLDKICLAVRGVLEKDQYKAGDWVQSHVTTFVKTCVPDLVGAMQFVKTLKLTQGPSVADSALQHLIFLVKADTLYDVALGMYDFPLVLMVAQYAQKDPREYLPFLRDLQSDPKPLQRFKIDEILGRKVGALGWLVAGGEDYWARSQQYIVQHGLYINARELFQTDAEKLKWVLEAHARVLTEPNPSEAGILFRLAGLLHESMDCFSTSGDWKRVMELASRLDKPCEEIVEIAKGLAERLFDQRRYADAAELMYLYGKDTNEAIRLFCRAWEWDAAIRIGASDSVLLESSKTASRVILEDVDDLETTWARNLGRLGRIRAEKLRRMVFVEDESVGDNIDMFSDTSSMVTRSVVSTTSLTSSNRTWKTSKQKRKQDRKKSLAKQGSIYEEDGLVNTLRKHVDRIKRMKKDVRGVLEVLIRVGEWELAKTVQNAFAKGLNVVKNGLDQAFPEMSSKLIEDFKTRLLMGESGTDMAVAFLTMVSDTKVEKPELDDGGWKLEILS